MPTYSSDEWAWRMAREEARERACTSALAGLRRAKTAGLWEYATLAWDVPDVDLMSWLPGQGSDGLDGNRSDLWRGGDR
ncbi:MAG TPA: hypothetical protein PKD55_00845 [Bellilinea sp.]|nr:hypothetical protein [Bellilinea sp.]